MTDIPHRSNDILDDGRPIPTRLPAGLSEAELLTGYEIASTATMALVCALSITRAFGVWGEP